MIDATMTELFIKILIEVTLITGVLGFYFTKREERMKKTIDEEFKKRDKFLDTRLNFKLRAVEEMLAHSGKRPVCADMK